jgi:hypothetical protein
MPDRQSACCSWGQFVVKYPGVPYHSKPGVVDGNNRKSEGIGHLRARERLAPVLALQRFES